ncbi:glycosyltransferase family protein [Filimonas effusa]|uniref:Glycosyl transferase n=1 Tax=Filimonas effusa TaxID=2508721 RepID=A0A4Q1CZT1_9BACT|nr:glycosyltransferase family protein [Filimonas effusa]RXK80917.1 glycosyl transferase [Filimonas effusa]
MRIFYAVQATGNGHIARAIELLPFLQQYGEVDVFLSGTNSNLKAALPIKYRSKGICLFYGNSGGLDYLKIARAFNPVRVWKEARNLPVEKYDVVINDFECITSLACKMKGVASVNFGHQASFKSANTPRPAKKDLIGEFVLQQYAKADQYVGLHFNSYDNFIFSPVLKQQVLNAQPLNNGHVTVYLSHYSDEVVAQSLSQVKDIRFEVFSKKVKGKTVQDNITFLPVDNETFTSSMINSYGVITGAGFETPAEALYLQKKLLCLPIKGQYEQLCNAAALEQFNVPIISTIDAAFSGHVQQWLNGPAQQPLHITNSTYEIVQHVVEKARAMRNGTALDNMLPNQGWAAI